MSERVQTVEVKLPVNGYRILIGPWAETKAELAALTANRRTLRVADSNTAKLLAPEAGEIEWVFPAGEASKTFETTARLCAAAARAGCDRSSLLVALGGGVVGDLTGFAAAIYMRGIDFAQIPTSLLAMVDSSVGGKTGVDLLEGKNLVGAFHQPKLVLIDPAFLKTLPLRERVGALAEVVKYAVIFDADFFAELERDAEKLIAPDPDPVLFAEVIRRCCQLKADIVAEDEREQGRRALLNYGHTYGHAAEMLSDFRLSHGEAVAIGMVLAGRLAYRNGYWSGEEFERQRRLLTRLGLPTELDPLYSREAMLELMGRDKKNRQGKRTFILPAAIGRAEIVRTLEVEAVREAMK